MLIRQCLRDCSQDLETWEKLQFTLVTMRFKEHIIIQNINLSHIQNINLSHRNIFEVLSSFMQTLKNELSNTFPLKKWTAVLQVLFAKYSRLLYANSECHISEQLCARKTCYLVILSECGINIDLIKTLKIKNSL